MGGNVELLMYMESKERLHRIMNFTFQSLFANEAANRDMYHFQLFTLEYNLHVMLSHTEDVTYPFQI